MSYKDIEYCDLSVAAKLQLAVMALVEGQGWTVSENRTDLYDHSELYVDKPAVNVVSTAFSPSGELKSYTTPAGLRTCSQEIELPVLIEIFTTGCESPLAHAQQVACKIQSLFYSSTESGTVIHQRPRWTGDSYLSLSEGTMARAMVNSSWVFKSKHLPEVCGYFFKTSASKPKSFPK